MVMSSDPGIRSRSCLKWNSQSSIASLRTTHTLFPLGSTTGKPISPSAMTAQEVERLVSLGVDWIESDDPERLLNLIG